MNDFGVKLQKLLGIDDFCALVLSVKEMDTGRGEIKSRPVMDPLLLTFIRWAAFWCFR